MDLYNERGGAVGSHGAGGIAGRWTVVDQLALKVALFEGWLIKSLVALICTLLFGLGCSKREPIEETHIEELGQPLLSSEWPAEGLVVTNSVQLDSRAQVTGEVAARVAATGSVLARSAELALEADAMITGDARADTLYVGNRATISNNAQYNTKSGAGTIGGTATTPLSLPLSVSLPTMPSVSPGATAVTVASNTTTTRAAGAYGVVTVQSGNAGSTTRLILSGGTYHFSSISIGNDARLECSADCEVRVNGRVTVGARSFIGASGAGLAASNMRLVVKGSNGSSGPNSLPAALGVDNDSQVDAYVFAPNGTMRLGQRSAGRGKIAARDVYFATDSTQVLVDLPVITQHPVDATTPPGQNVTFSVIATGFGITYQWQRNGVNISGATSASLGFVANSRDNGAQYRVVVTNTAGSVTSNAALLTVVTCLASDTECNGIDDDCDGNIDEDYVPSCGEGAGNPRLTCVNGVILEEACDDADACNGEESCLDGVCQAGSAPNVDDGNPCTVDTCEPATGVIHTPVTAGTVCADDTVCNGTETCNGAGECVAGTPLEVDDGNPCTADSCDPEAGVVHVAVASGTSCSDENACNGSETCDGSGVCQSGTAPTIDDGNPCTADSCDPETGVVHVAVVSGTSCSDGNFCNGSETCDGSGVCQSGTAPTVDDGNPCTADSCDPVLGVVHSALPSGTACGDNNVCNGTETCNGAGACVAGTPPNVDDGNPCTADSCDPEAGVVHVAVASGTSCSDENACNGSETCDGVGACQAGVAPNIDDGNPCTVDSCDPETGVLHEPAAQGTACADTDQCNGAETCDGSGECVAGTPPDVDDGNPCTADSCDPETGVVHEPLAAGTDCSDGEMCNGAEVCDGYGVCEPGTPLPDDGNGGCCDVMADVYPWETLELDPTLVTTYTMRALPLFTGDERSQTPLDEVTIDKERVAVVHGYVFDEEGAPLACATVNVLHREELGKVRTLADGSFALAVNGGESMTLQYSHPDYMTSYRALSTQALRDAFAPEVRLMAHGVAQPVSASATTITVVAGDVETDEDGTRSATLLVPPGTTASVAGESEARQNYAIRVQEVTNRSEVGRAGMQATLPPQTMFTYAVSFDVDGAEGKDVELSQPIPVYVENFLEFPIGEIAPVGRYDVALERWVAEESGRVIRIVGVDGAGRATLDINSTPGADDVSPLAITDAERVILAQRYSVGTSLWRFRVHHFSPWDINWGGGPGPNDPLPGPDDPSGGGAGGGGGGGAGGGAPGPGPGPDGPAPCEAEGSIIECETQVLKERIGVYGTPVELVYSSGRQPGRSRELNIPLIGTDLPENLRQIELRIQVAGREFAYQFERQANQTHQFTWDGRDRSGRLLNGRQKIGAAIGYTYPITYQQTERFGYNGNGVPITGARERGEVTLWKNWSGEIGGANAQYPALGGWTVSIHHMLDPMTATVYLGDGGDFQIPEEYSELVTVVGTGSRGFSGDGGLATQAQIDLNGFQVNSSLAVAADGTIYLADSANDRIRQVGLDGIITTIAGGGVTLGDGGSATSAKLDEPSAVVLAADGHLYIADSLQHRIRKVELDTGIITTVVGTGMAGFSGDGGVPTSASVNKPTGLAVTNDGTMFIADSFNNRIRRVRDGIITSVASGLNYPTGVAVGRDGVLFFSNYLANQIGKVSISGQVSPAVGTGSASGTPPYGDGGPALSAQLLHPDGVAIGPDGLLYFVDTEHHLVRRVNGQGNVESLVGTGAPGYSGENLPATRSAIFRPRGFTVSPDGSIYVVDSENHRIRRVRKSQRVTTSSGGLFVPLSGGTQVAEFDSEGRHLRTIDAYSGATIFAFGYDSAGRLTSITDVDGRVTEIERNGVGRVTAIHGPDGQTTALAVQFAEDGDVLHEVVRPDGGRYVFTYGDDGMMLTMRDPKLEDEEGNSYAFNYSAGRLVSDRDPLGGEQTLTHNYTPGGSSVTRTSPLGRAFTFGVTSDAQSYQRVVERPDGTQSVTEVRRDLKPVFLAPNGTSYDERVKFPDGSTAYYLMSPAPTWGLSAPVTSEGIMVLPSGLTRTERSSHILTLDPITGSLLNETRTSTVNARTSSIVWDGTTRTFIATSAANRPSFRVVNHQGRTIQSGAPGIESTHFEYNSDGRLQTILQGSRATTFEYDTSTGPTRGTLLRTIDALNQTTEYTSDALGRLTSVKAPDNSITGFDWDANSNLTAVVPPGQPLHEQAFDALNQRTAYVPPALSGVPNVQTTYSFDADRNPVTTLRPDGSSLGFVYDSAGRLDVLQTPAGSTDYEYYSAIPSAGGAPGALQSISTPAGITLAFKYDGSLVTEENLAGTGLTSINLAWAYDTDFRAVSETLSGVPGAQVAKFGYDPDSLQTCLSVGQCSPPDGGALVTVYDPQLPRPTQSTVGALQTTWMYNNYGELSTLETASGGTLLFQQQTEASGIARDELGRIVSNRVTNGPTVQHFEYTYDAQGRLATVTRDSVLTEIYVYDSNGNRLAVTTPSGTVEANYDAQDRLLSYGDFDYTYTANGDLATKTDTVSGDTWTYTYDVQGNLVQVALPNGDLIEYLVDGRNRRVGKRVNGTLVRQWVWSNQLRLAAELDGAGNLISQFLYGNLPTTPDLVVRSSGTYRVIADHLGSVRALVNVNNPSDVLARLDYTAFGEVSGGGVGVIPQGFAGGLYDADTNLMRFGARDYDPVVGRWVSKDPILWDGGQENLYVYVGNQPVNLVDVSGRWFWVVPLAEAAAATAAQMLQICAIALGGAALLDEFNKVEREGTRTCPDCPTPPPDDIHMVPGEHGCPNGHVHFFQYNQNPQTCQCYLQRLTRCL